MKRPKDLLGRVGGALKRGGVFVVHEYFDYSTWRVSPRSPDLEQFVSEVMESWRASGGEPDIGLDLPVWLEELGFEIKTLRPIVDVIRPSDFTWEWPKAFIDVGVRRLVDLGHMTEGRAQAIKAALASAETTPHAIMITPAVLEIIAIRR